MKITLNAAEFGNPLVLRAGMSVLVTIRVRYPRGWRRATSRRRARRFAGGARSRGDAAALRRRFLSVTAGADPHRAASTVA